MLSTPPRVTLPLVITPHETVLGYITAGAATRGRRETGSYGARVDRTQALCGMGGSEAAAMERHRYWLPENTGGTG